MSFLSVLLTIILVLLCTPFCIVVCSCYVDPSKVRSSKFGRLLNSQPLWLRQLEVAVADFMIAMLQAQADLIITTMYNYIISNPLDADLRTDHANTSAAQPSDNRTHTDSTSDAVHPAQRRALLLMGYSEEEIEALDSEAFVEEETQTSASENEVTGVRWEEILAFTGNALAMVRYYLRARRVLFKWGKLVGRRAFLRKNRDRCLRILELARVPHPISQNEGALRSISAFLPLES